ncbi:MAG: hypothetical protein KAY32_16205 [Candidatus Eisenbacteria sp.]|nr:hypothetical protein [Candidatus Eisenbacteria bacterium]
MGENLRESRSVRVALVPHGFWNRCGIAIALMCVLGIRGLVSPAFAYFERSQAGARSTALGKAYSAIASDASATHWNPAALVTLPRSEVLFMYTKPFLIENLQENYVALAVPRDAFSLGLGWHHTGVADVVGEDMVSLGIARDLLPPGSSFAVAIGGALKLAHVGYVARAEQDYGREYHLTGDIGVLVNPTRKMAWSYVVRNVNQPSFEFVDGGGGTQIRRTHDFGLAYQWKPAALFALSADRDFRGDWALHAGTEVWFFEVFGLRTGFSAGQFSGGAGLRTRHYLVDVAFITHDDLGASYEVSLRVPFGKRRW